MKIFTIGFTKTSAKEFFEKLKTSGVKKILDVRLNNQSQLAGFAKANDLKYFAQTICSADYEHFMNLAPTGEIFKAYQQQAKQKKARDKAWQEYESKFLKLMAERKIEELDRNNMDEGCLLCSEHKPHYCHRKLVANYLKEQWGDVEVEHLVTESQEKVKE